MAYDINQLLDNLPSLLMQHNRDEENKRQFDVTTDKTEEERLRQFGLQEKDYGLRKDEADYKTSVRSSYDKLGRVKTEDLKRRKAYEGQKPEMIEALRNKDPRSLFGLLPKWMMTDNMETRYMDEIKAGRPTVSIPELDTYDPSIYNYQREMFPNQGNIDDRISLIHMINNQGKLTTAPYGGK